MLRGSRVWNDVEVAVTVAGGRFTILGPTLFFGNDLRGKGGMMGPGGVYGEPIGTKGVSRVDVKDIALAVVKVAEEPGRWSGRKIMIGSRELYTVSSPWEPGWLWCTSRLMLHRSMMCLGSRLKG